MIMTQKRISTLDKKFMKKVQEHILSYFDNYNCMLSEFKNAQKIFGYNWADELLQGGCFDIYYSQVADTMGAWFNMSPDEIWQYFKDDNEKLWNAYKKIVTKNIKYILRARNCYLTSKKFSK